MLLRHLLAALAAGHVRRRRPEPERRDGPAPTRIDSTARPALRFDGPWQDTIAALAPGDVWDAFSALPHGEQLRLIEAELATLVPGDRARVLTLLGRELQRRWLPLPGPQTAALTTEADVLFYGGGAGGGKSALLCGVAITGHHRSRLFRRESVQVRGLVDECTKIMGSRDGYSGQQNVWRLPGDRQIEFAHCQYEHDKEKYQGRAADLIGFDEITHFCLHPDTEVLTDSGWLAISNVTTRHRVLAMAGDGAAGYESVTATHEFDYDGPLHKTNHKSLRYAVTPNHKMVVVSQTSDKWRFVRADSLPVYSFYPFSRAWAGAPVDRVSIPVPTGRGVGCNANVAADVDAGDWAEFLGWYLAEGSCFETGERSGPRVNIRQTKAVASLDALMARLPWRSKWVDGEGYNLFSRQLFAALKPLGNRYEKRVPRWLLDSDEGTLRRFFEAFVDGDGHRIKTGAIAIGLCNAGLRDDLQEVATKLGLRSTATTAVVRSGHTVHRLSVHKPGRTTLWEAPQNRYVENYVGKVHCLTVEPSHTFLCRLEGRTFWTGNSESQFRYLINWNRAIRDGAQQRTRVIVTGNPPETAEGRWVVAYWAPWLDPDHPNPAQDGELRWFTTIGGVDREVDGPGPHGTDALGQPIVAKSRTFIRSRVTDNPYMMEAGYAATLQSLPEPLRSMLLEGRFDLAASDDPWQVIPSSWVELAQRRWTIDPPAGALMTCMGVDVAQGGPDETVLIARYGSYFASPKAFKGVDTKDGQAVAGLVFAHMRDGCEIAIDVGGGWGADAHGHLKGQKIKSVAVNWVEPSIGVTRAGSLPFLNKRAESWWRLREALDPNGSERIALPPDKTLAADLATPLWRRTPSGLIKIEDKADIRKRLGRSPDRGDAAVMAWAHGGLVEQERANNPRPTMAVVEHADAKRRPHRSATSRSRSSWR